MQKHVLVKQWKFWKKVKELNNTDPLAYAVALAKRHKLKEIRYYENLVDKFESVEEIKSKFNDDVKSAIRTKAAKGRSRYITYLSINPDLVTPSVYTKLNRFTSVCMIAKLRTVSHNLQVDMGRRTGTPRNERKCRCGDVEDEEHFMLKCLPRYPTET